MEDVGGRRPTRRLGRRLGPGMRGEREALRGRVPSICRGKGHGAWERSQPPPQSTTADNVRNVTNSKMAVSSGRHCLLCGGPQMRGSRPPPGEFIKA